MKKQPQPAEWTHKTLKAAELHGKRLIFSAYGTALFPAQPQGTLKVFPPFGSQTPVIVQVDLDEIYPEYGFGKCYTLNADDVVNLRALPPDLTGRSCVVLDTPARAEGFQFEPWWLPTTDESRQA